MNRILRLFLVIALLPTMAIVFFSSPPAHAQIMTGSLTTTFASNNGFAGNMLDVMAFEDITITSLDINVEPGTYDVEVYYKVGSYVGSESTPGDWTLLGTANVTSNGTDVPTPLPVGGLSIPSGSTYGLYVTLSAAHFNGIRYTGQFSDPPEIYTNTEIEITTGVGKGSPPFTGSTFFYRQWNGTIYYEYGMTVPEPPAFAVPNLGEVMITSEISQFGYGAPGGEPARTASGAGVWLPHDFDGNGFDTYTVTGSTEVDGETWLSIFIGNETWVWVPEASVITIR